MADIDTVDCAKLLKPAQIRALKAVFLAKNISAGLKTARVARRTFYFWIANDKTFCDALDESRKTLLTKGKIEIEGLLYDAINQLGEGLESDDIEIRLRAAKEIINTVIKFKTLNIEEKINKILLRLGE